MAVIHKGKVCTPAQVAEILALRPDDIDSALMKKYFAHTQKHPEPMFNTWDTLEIPAGKIRNKDKFQTTVGRYIFNLCCIPLEYLEVYGFVNETLDGKTLGKLENKFGQLVAEDKMPFDSFAKAVTAMEWLGFNTSRWICPTFGISVNKMLPEVAARKEELMAEYADDLEKNDVTTVSKIENELLDIASKTMDKNDNEGFDYYRSGARGSIDNNYKNTSVMRGMVKDLTTNKFTFVKSNYFDGLSKTDAPKCFNVTIESGYSRGVNTANTGYEAKKVTNAMQTLLSDDSGSDCHTPYALDVELTDYNAEMFHYRYIVDGDTTLLLTPDNIKQYVGHIVKMRSPMFCKGDKICNICAGELSKVTGVKNLSATATKLTSALTGLSLKQFHQSNIETKELNIYDYLQSI